MTNKALRKPSTPEKTIRFLEYLKKNTDKNHTMKLADVKAAFREMDLNPGNDKTLHDFIVHIADTCNLTTEEDVLPEDEWRLVFDDYVKTYGSLDGEECDLSDMDEDIKDYMQIKNLYYNPEFSYAEIDALIEAVQFSRTLTKEESDKIIRTLEEKFTSRYYSRGASHICKIHENIKYDKKQLRQNLLTIQQAIEDDVQIAYQFNGYTHDKKLKPYGNYMRMVSPYYIVAYSGKYYLLAANERYKEAFILRIDLMTEVYIPERDEVTGNHEIRKKGIKRIPKRDVSALPQEWDQYYLLKHINMSYDVPVRITLRVKSAKQAQNSKKHENPEYTFLYDVFGDNYMYIRADAQNPDYDIVVVECSPFGMVNFALQYADKIEVLEPADVREQVKEKVRHLQQKYFGAN